MRWARRLVLAGTLAFTLLSFAATVAMTVSSTVFNLVSSVVELLSDRPTIRRQQNAEATRLRRDLARTAADRDRLNRELAERTVTYRGSKRLVREAVADTSERVSRRVAAGATRSVASAAGEALPLIGVGVVAAAAAYELYDACEMMKELRALDVAFNPESAISEREVCGMRAPTSEEIWASVKASPSAAWSTATDYYRGLDEIDAGAMFGSAYGWILAWNPWADEAGAQPEPTPDIPGAEHAAP